MKMKIFRYFCYLIVFALGVKFAQILITNSIFLSHYNSELYEASDLDPNKFLNIQEPYIVHYNLGNVAYQTNDYTTAIDEYNSALGLFPSGDRVCQIRVNLALSYLGIIKYEVESEKDIQNLKSSLNKIIDVLHENNCANLDDTGDSKEAETLEQDIQDYLDALEQAQQGGQGEDDDDPEEEDPDDSGGSDSREDELNNRTDNASAESSENQELYEYFDEEDYYHGIRW